MVIFAYLIKSTDIPTEIKQTFVYQQVMSDTTLLKVDKILDIRNYIIAQTDISNKILMIAINKELEACDWILKNLEK